VSLPGRPEGEFPGAQRENSPAGAAQAAGARFGLPRHVPRGVECSLATLLGLRRHGTGMRALLEIDARRRDGLRVAAARGHGMDYAESRLYSPGDDVRRIDWRVTARTGRAHTKLYQPERGSDVFCVVDQRGPMRFGTRAAFKSVVAAHLGALTAWATVDGGDRFAALVAGGDGASVPASSSAGAAAALCEALAAAPAGAGDPPLDAVAARAAREAAPGARFVVVTDLLDPGDTIVRAMQSLQARGDVTLVWVYDAMEASLPPPARYPLTDGRDVLLLDTGRADVRAAQARAIAARRERFARLAAQPGMRCRAVRTGDDLFDALARPFASGSLDAAR
jgi:uncharacterized protein (DUF58 family)